MMVDMEMMLSQPETYVRLIPNFFFRQSNFFRHFMLAVQFTCTEGVVYPNIVLLYKRVINRSFCRVLRENKHEESQNTHSPQIAQIKTAKNS